MVYEVAIKGKHVKPGVLLKFTTDDYNFTYRKTRSLLSFKTQRISKERRVDALRSILSQLLSGTQEERLHAIANIRHHNLWEGIPALIEVLPDEDAEIRKQAHLTLRRMTRKYFSPDVRAWRRWWLQQEKNIEKRRRQFEEN